MVTNGCTGVLRLARVHAHLLRMTEGESIAEIADIARDRVMGKSGLAIA
jgi:hypothetical protein